MSMRRPIEIVGGGLAGLSLGIALRRADVPVTIFEAGAYPRHRVCGEFIAGLKTSTVATLGLEPFLEEACRHQRVAWFSRSRSLGTHSLPRPALAISRHVLDARLADAFTALGGDLQCHQRVEIEPPQPGRVFACGRRRSSRSPWLGLKAHVAGLPLEADLEFHLGKGAYVGLCRIESGVVNVCGLLRREERPTGQGREFFLGALRRHGLGALAGRVAEGEFIPESLTAVAGMSYENEAPLADRISLGDHFATIPPYTGNGMSLAFQSAECALLPLCEWSRGRGEWAEVVTAVMRAVRARAARRLRIARALHPYLLSSPRQFLFGVAQRAGLLPLRAMTRAIHA
jgi:menaquinone-9 beta-reductase